MYNLKCLFKNNVDLRLLNKKHTRLSSRKGHFDLKIPLPGVKPRPLDWPFYPFLSLDNRT